GLPISWVSRAAQFCFPLRKMRATPCMHDARSPNEVARQRRCASNACWSAWSTCCSENSSNVSTTSSVAGLIDCITIGSAYALTGARACAGLDSLRVVDCRFGPPVMLLAYLDRRYAPD